MSNRFLGILLIVAGLITPMHKESLRPLDWTLMLLFLGFGILLLLLSFKKKTAEDEIYRVRLELADISLLNENGLPSLQEGQQLFVSPYAGEQQEEIHILTEGGQLIGSIPEEHRDHVLYKYENHSPIHLVVRSLNQEGTGEPYTITIEMMC